MAPKRPVSLRTKWTAVLLLVTLVPLSAVAVVSVRIQRRGLERAEKELEVAVVDDVATSIASVLGEASETTHRVGQALADDRIADGDTRLTLAEEALARSETLASVAIFSADGAFIDALAPKAAHGGPAKPEAPPSDLTASVRQEARSGLWMQGAAEGRGDDLRYVEPMTRDGKERGWVVGRLVPGDLSRRVGRISESRFGADSRVFVVDSSYRVVATEAKGTLGVASDLTGRDIFAVVPFGTSTWRKDFGLTTSFVGEGGVPMVGTVRTLPERGWAVVAERPEAEAFADLTEARHAFFAAIGAVAVLAVALGALFARRTTAPVASLVALTRAYGRREFARQSEVRSNDELEELGDSLTDMAKALSAGEIEITRRAAVEAGLSRYLPAEIARAVASGERGLALGGERKEVSALFADVAAFTSFSERTSPENVVTFLNELFSILTEVVFRHEGMVDKFMGDCIMAIFSAAPGGPHHAERAVAAAEDMHRFVEAQAGGWQARFGFDVRVGIGVASGPALLGNLGSDQRLEYTAIGDTVNVASRLEGLARPGQTLVTQEVTAAVSGAFEFASLGRHALRGKVDSVEIFELVT